MMLREAMTIIPDETIQIPVVAALAIEDRAYARGRADGYKELRLSYSCAHCGAFAKVPASTLDMLDAGTTLRCSECGGATVVDLFRPEDMAELYRRGGVVPEAPNG